MTEPIWRPSPSRAGASLLARFMEEAERDWNITLEGYESVHAWSVDKPEQFWTSVKDFCGISAETWGNQVLVDGDKMPGAKFFPDARLNFAENLLRRRDDAEAMVFRGEDKVERRLTWRQLHDQVSRMAQAMAAAGITEGDRVGAITANMPEAIIAMLAALGLGAIWSSCSPDFGVQGILDRFGQIEPKVLVCVDGYYYAGKTHGVMDKLAQVVDKLPSVEASIIIPYAGSATAPDKVRTAIAWDDFIKDFTPGDIAFNRVPFNHPGFILYSSGTTGAPKCIVHSAAGMLFQVMKEHQLHCDIKPGDRLFYFTTCGWMMWNWLAIGLASQATLLLYDGSPFHPGPSVLFDYADAEGMTLFGTSAKYIDAVKKSGLEPINTHSLASVRTMASTGSPLVPESFDFVYQSIKANIHLASISGGTDLAGCFVISSPIDPVWRGEIQRPALGMKVEVYDEDGHPMQSGKGELVCTRPFPSMPVMFWNDPSGDKYRGAYFEKYPNIWCHGDWIEFTEHGGAIIHGRSDATLNPGGVRIGTAEIYRQVEQLEEVVESIVIGQQWDNDVRVVLFVVLRPGLELDDSLRDRIRKRIRENCTPRHVPARIVQVADIPRTKSGKITELAVRDVVHGRGVKNKEALANPEALDLFKHIPALQT